MREWIFFICVVISVGCSKKNVEVFQIEGATNAQKLDRINTTIFDEPHHIELKGKISFQNKYDSGKANFICRINDRGDLWLNVKKLGFQVARAKVTAQDSFYILYNLENLFEKGHLSELDEYLKTVDQEVLKSIVINIFPNQLQTEDIQFDKESFTAQLEHPLALKYFGDLNAEGFIDRVNIDTEDGHTLQMIFQDYKLVGDRYKAHDIQLFLKGNYFRLDISDFRIQDEPYNTPFIIPTHYEDISNY